jgi:hypothetical protein
MTLWSVGPAFADGTLSIIAAPFASKCRDIVLQSVGHDLEWKILGDFDAQRDCFTSGTAIACQLDVFFTVSEKQGDVTVLCTGDFLDQEVKRVTILQKENAVKSGISLPEDRFLFSQEEGQY